MFRERQERELFSENHTRSNYYTSIRAVHSCLNIIHSRYTESQELLHSWSGFEDHRYDRITIPALNELNNHPVARRYNQVTTRKSRRSQATGPLRRKPPSSVYMPSGTLTLVNLIPRYSVSPRGLRVYRSRGVTCYVCSVSTVSGVSRRPSRSFRSGLDSNRLVFPRRISGEGNADEATGVERRSGGDSRPRRLARLVRYFNGSLNLRYFVGRDRRWRATRVFIMRC